jgi:hypothetical protein
MFSVFRFKMLFCVVIVVTTVAVIGGGFSDASVVDAHQIATAPFTPLGSAWDNLGPASSSLSTAAHNYSLPSEPIGATISNGTSSYFGPLMTDVNSDGILDMVLSRPGPGGSNGELWSQFVALGTGIGFERVYVCRVVHTANGVHDSGCGCTRYPIRYYGDCAQ